MGFLVTPDPAYKSVQDTGLFIGPDGEYSLEQPTITSFVYDDSTLETRLRDRFHISSRTLSPVLSVLTNIEAINPTDTLYTPQIIDAAYKRQLTTFGGWSGNEDPSDQLLKIAAQTPETYDDAAIREWQRSPLGVDWQRRGAELWKASQASDNSTLDNVLKIGIPLAIATFVSPLFAGEAIAGEVVAGAAEVDAAIVTPYVADSVSGVALGESAVDYFDFSNTFPVSPAYAEYVTPLNSIDLESPFLTPQNATILPPYISPVDLESPFLTPQNATILPPYISPVDLEATTLLPTPFNFPEFKVADIVKAGTSLFSAGLAGKVAGAQIDSLKNVSNARSNVSNARSNDSNARSNEIRSGSRALPSEFMNLPRGQMPSNFSVPGVSSMLASPPIKTDATMSLLIAGGFAFLALLFFRLKG